MLDIDKVLSNVLKKHFKDFSIYQERPEKMKLPCIILKTIQSSFDKKLGNLYKNELMYQIVFIESEDKNYLTDYELYKNIAFKLFEILEFIEVKGKKIKGYDMKYRIEDNTLQFFVMFKIRYYRNKEQILMNEMDLNTLLKGE